MPVWTEQDAIDMTRYGIVWRVVSVKPHVGGGQWIRYRLVRRKGNRFDFVGPIKTTRKWFEKPVKPGDMLFRDHDTREWTRMEIMTPEEARRAEKERTQEKTCVDEVAAVDGESKAETEEGTSESIANQILREPILMNKEFDGLKKQFSKMAGFDKGRFDDNSFDMQVEACRELIRRYCSKTKNVNRRVTTYNWKHVFERLRYKEADRNDFKSFARRYDLSYVHEACAIAAFVLEGFKLSRKLENIDFRRDVYVNVSSKDYSFCYDTAIMED